MYAIVSIAGHQYKVMNDQTIFVNRLPNEEGSELKFDQVLLVDQENGSVQIGAPTVAGASIQAKVVAHVKGDKVIVFHKKRRKGFQNKRGHRQQFTKILIQSISA
ncbi:MAG: 50S ribosomal protein L21 [Bacteroidia bacterium]|nr:50S ribosomal protein L21 [Bacteroidia bacterium]